MVDSSVACPDRNSLFGILPVWQQDGHGGKAADDKNDELAVTPGFFLSNLIAVVKSANVK